MRDEILNLDRKGERIYILIILIVESRTSEGLEGEKSVEDGNRWADGEQTGKFYPKKEKREEELICTCNIIEPGGYFFRSIQ